MNALPTRATLRKTGTIRIADSQIPALPYFFTTRVNDMRRRQRRVTNIIASLVGSRYLEQSEWDNFLQQQARQSLGHTNVY